MPVFYKIDKERKLVLSTASGTFSRVEALDHQEKLRNDPDFDPSYAQLLDFSQVTKVALTPADVHRLAERNMFSPTSRRAILVNGDLAYGLARMYEILRDAAGETGIRVFLDLDEALDWVLSKRKAP